MEPVESPDLPSLEMSQLTSCAAIQLQSPPIPGAGDDLLATSSELPNRHAVRLGGGTSVRIPGRRNTVGTELGRDNITSDFRSKMLNSMGVWYRHVWVPIE